MCTLYKILQWLNFFYKIHHQLSIIIHFVKKIKFKQFPDIGWRRLVGDKKSPQPDKTSPQAKRHELSLQVTWTKKLCFFVQVKLSHICDPQKFFNKRDQSIRIFLMFIEHVFEAFTGQELGQEVGWGLWRPDIQRLSWGRFQRATFSNTANVQNINFFLTSYLFVWTLQIYRKHPSVLHNVAAHLQTITMVLER